MSLNTGTNITAEIVPNDSKDTIAIGRGNHMKGGPFSYARINDPSDPDQPYNSMYTIPQVRRTWGSKCTIWGEVDATLNGEYELQKGYVDNNLMNNANWRKLVATSTPELIRFTLIKRIPASGNGLVIDRDRDQYFEFVSGNSTIVVRSLVDDSEKATITFPTAAINFGPAKGILVKKASLAADRILVASYTKIFVFNPNDYSFVTTINDGFGFNYVAIDIQLLTVNSAYVFACDRPVNGGAVVRWNLDLNTFAFTNYTVVTLTVDYPNDLLVDARYNRLFICQRQGNRVTVRSLTAPYAIIQEVSGFLAPAYLFIDYPANRLLVTDIQNGHIAVVNLQDLEVKGSIGSFNSVQDFEAMFYEDNRIRYYFLKASAEFASDRHIDIYIES